MSNLLTQQNSALSIMPSQAEFQMMKDMALIAIKSGLMPSAINTPEKAIIIILKGRELNIPPMMALSHISVINGKPCMSSELMLAKIYENIPNSVVDIVSTNESECVIMAQRPGGTKTRFSFTIEDARVAGLLGKGPWKQYPTAMLRARAISAMARALFPDAINGISYTPEEMGAEVDIDDSGSEIAKDVTPKEPPKVQPTREEPKPDALIGQAEARHIFDTAAKKNFRNEDVKEILKGIFNIEATSSLLHSQYIELIKLMSTKSIDDIRIEISSRIAEEELAKEIVQEEVSK